MYYLLVNHAVAVVAAIVLLSSLLQFIQVISVVTYTIVIPYYGKC